MRTGWVILAGFLLSACSQFGVTSGQGVNPDAPQEFYEQTDREALAEPARFHDGGTRPVSPVRKGE